MIAVREFESVSELQAHYAAVRARINAPREIKPVRRASRILAPGELGRRAFRHEASERERHTKAAKQAEEARVLEDFGPHASAIVKAVAAIHRVRPAEIVGTCRTADVIRARFHAIAAVRAASPDWSTPRLGRMFGGRHHTTILDALRRAKELGLGEVAL